MNPTRAYQQQKLTPAELDTLSQVSPRKFPQMMPCLTCGNVWMTHKGMLCPEQVGHISDLKGPNGGHIIITPKIGTNVFVPDEDYYKRPDFEVI